MKPTLGMLLLITAALLGGCQTWRGYTVGHPDMLTYVQQLSQMDSDHLEAEFSHVYADWQQRPSTENWARLGLVRGQPGYPDYKPASAVENLRTALEGTAQWDAATRLYLQQRLSQLQHAAQRESELSSLEQENAQLRDQLSKARDKLQALTDIERDLGSGN